MHRRYAYAALIAAFLLTGCNDVPLDYADLRDLAGAEGLDTDTLDMAALALSFGEQMAADDSTSPSTPPKVSATRWTELGGQARVIAASSHGPLAAAIWASLEHGQNGVPITATTAGSAITITPIKNHYRERQREGSVLCRTFLMEIGPAHGTRSVYTEEACRGIVQHFGGAQEPMWQLSASNPKLLSKLAALNIGGTVEMR